MSQETEATIPRDAAEALELWDKGEAIAAFEVESGRCTHQEIYAVAFEMIRSGNVPDSAKNMRLPAGVSDEILAKITKREFDVAHSIAFVAQKNGWSAMVASHLTSGHIKAISISKSSPKEQT